jgi:hypothetical protein
MLKQHDFTCCGAVCGMLLAPILLAIQTTTISPPPPHTQKHTHPHPHRLGWVWDDAAVDRPNCQHAVVKGEDLPSAQCDLALGSICREGGWMGAGCVGRGGAVVRWRGGKEGLPTHPSGYFGWSKGGWEGANPLHHCFTVALSPVSMAERWPCFRAIDFGGARR